MNTCPNIKSQEWLNVIDALKSLGLNEQQATREAYRDYFTYDDIRTADEVVNDYTERTESNNQYEETQAINENINFDIANNKLSLDTPVNEENAYLYQRDIQTEINKLKQIKALKTLGSDKKIKERLNNVIDPSITSVIVHAIELDPSLKELDPYTIFQKVSQSREDSIAADYNEYIQKKVDAKLEAKLLNYLSEYNIDFDSFSGFAEEHGVKGLYDIIGKTIYVAKNRNFLTVPEEFAHAFVELMGSVYQKNVEKFPENKDFSALYDSVESTSIYKQVYEQYKDIYTKNGEPDLYKIKKEAIGQALAVAIANKWNMKEESGQSFWSKLKQWFESILTKFANCEYLNFQSLIDKISDEIMKDDHSRLQKVDSSKYTLLDYDETLVKQNKKDNGTAVSFMQYFTNLGNIITGSLSYRYQGTVYRGKLDSIHDVDMVVPVSTHGLDLNSEKYKTLISRLRSPHTRSLLFNDLMNQDYFKKIQKDYPDIMFLSAFTSGDEYITVNAIYCTDRKISERFSNLSGNYAKRLEHFTEKERDKIYLFDFFLESDYHDRTFIRDENYKINLADFKQSFEKKQFGMGRAKDIYDYQMWNLYEEFKKNYIPDENNFMYQQKKAEQGYIESVSKKRRYNAEEKNFLENDPVPAYVTRITDGKTRGGYGTNIDDYTRQPIKFYHLNGDETQWIGRQLYSSEIFALSEYSSSYFNLYNGRINYKTRYSIQNKLTAIMYDYNTNFRFGDMFLSDNSMFKVSCLDIDFLHYLHDNMTKEGRYIGTPQGFDIYLKSKGIQEGINRKKYPAVFNYAWTEQNGKIIRPKSRKTKKTDAIEKFDNNNKKVERYIDTERIENYMYFMTGKPVNWKYTYDQPASNIDDRMSQEEVSAFALMNESSNMRRFKDAVDYFERRGYNYSDLVDENTMTRLYNVQLDENDRKGSEAFIEKLSKKLGIPFEFISIVEATNMLANTKIPFNSSTDACFFYNGKCYFIKDRFDKHLAVHEFSHPFVQAILKTNPELFNNLYNRLKDSEIGTGIINMVKDLYNEYEFEDEQFKEECIVMAIEYHSRGIYNDRPITENKFLKFIKDLFYSIKQLLRNSFVKSIDVSNLNADTTINELYDMLKSDASISVEERNLSFDDIARFSHSYNELVDDLNARYDNSELSKAIDITFDVFDDYMKQLDRNSDFAKLNMIHKNFFGTTDFQKTFANIKDLHGVRNIKLLDEMVSENQQLRMRAHTLGKSIITMQKISTDIHNQLIDISNSTLNKDSIKQIYSYNKLLTYWLNSLKELNEIFSDKKSLSNSKIISSFINETRQDVEECISLINDMFLDVATDVIFENLQTKYDNMQQLFITRVGNKDGQIGVGGQLDSAPQILRDQTFKEFTGLDESEYKEFERLYESGANDTNNTRFAELKAKTYNGLIKTKDQIRDTIKGELGDANYLNSKFEGYLYSTDPVIGSFASFLRDQLTSAEQRTQQRFNELYQKIQSDLNKMNLNKVMVGEFGKKFMFQDTVLSFDKDGNYVKKKVWTFLNPFKDYRADYEELDYDTRKAREEWENDPNDETYKKYLDTKMQFDAFKIRYMHQEYVPEYYLPYLKLLHSPAGQAAIIDKERINVQIKMLKMFKNDPMMTYSDNLDEQIEELEFQLRRLSSLYNIDGTLKSKESVNGIPSEYDKAEALRKYNEESSRFVDYEIDYDSFDNDFITFYKGLIDQGYNPESETFKNMVTQWERKYMKAQFKEDFQEDVSAILDKMSNLSKSINKEASEEMKKLRSMVSGCVDNFGEIIEDYFNPDWIKEIHDAQVKIEGMRRKSKAMYNLFNQLNSLVVNVPTVYYMDQLKNQMIHMTSSDLRSAGFSTDMDKFVQELEDTYENSHPVDKLLNKYSDFAKWFNENHILHTSEYTDESGNKITTYRYSRLFCHNRMKAVDESNEVTYTVKDPNTNTVVATLHGLPGYRYRKSYVKDEFITDKVEGVTIDNKGKFLPRIDAKDSPYINQEYLNMDKNSPEYRILEELKRTHLDAQKNSPYSSRLYLDAPRFRTEMKEVIVNAAKEGLKNTFSLFLKRMRMFFTGGADDFEFGASNAQKNVMTEVTKIDSMDDIFSHSPVSGKYDLDIEDVSTNIFRSMFRYYASLDRENALRDIAPISAAIETSLDESKIRDNKYQKFTNGVKYLTKDENIRREAFKNLIEREYQGITLKGPLSESAATQNIINFLFGRASFSFFAMNVPSALKNSFGIKFQALLESSAGKYLTPQALAYGNLWSYEAMAEMTFGGFYDTRKEKSLKRRIVEAFDLQGQDIAGDTFMDPLWRSFGTDILDGKLLYFPRKWVEQQATCQVGSAILYKTQVNKIDSDGKINKISYIDAFEVVDGNLVLKKGVDARYGLTSIEYVIRPDDTFESIMRRFNLTGKEGEEYLKRALKGKSVDEIKTLMNEYEERRNYRINSLEMLHLSDRNKQARLNEIENEYQTSISSLTLRLNNDKFLDVHRQILQVNNDLGGAYAKFDQPDMYRNIIYRFCAYMRRYFTTMFMNRFRWNSRYNPGLGEIQRGFYIQTADFLINIFRTAGKNIMYASNEEKRALIKFGTEMAMLAIIPLLCSFLFGFDPDDEDRYKKLRKKSGALGAPFTVDDKNRDFNLLGFTELHALHLLMQIRQENEQFNPFCGGVKQINSMLDLKSVVWGPTTDSMTQIMEDIKKTVQNDPRAYYTRDIGPYEWQQKGSNKTANHLAKMFGFTGTSLDPALAIQNLQANISKIHR